MVQKRIYPQYVQVRMITNDIAFFSYRKRLVGVCDTPLPYRQEEL